MKNYIKALMILVFSATVLSGYAQPREPRNAAERAERRTERLQKELDLNETQRQQVYDRHLMMEENRIGRHGRATTRQVVNETEMAKDRMDAEIMDHKAEMKKILTPDQYNRWTKMIDEELNSGPDNVVRKNKRRNR